MTNPRLTLLASTAWRDRWILDVHARTDRAGAERAMSIDADSAWQALEKAGVAESEIVAAACSVIACEPASLDACSPAVADVLERRTAEHYGVVVTHETDREVTIATSNPLSPDLESDLEFVTGRRVRLVVAAPAAIRAAQIRVYQRPQLSTPAQGHSVQWLGAISALAPLAAPTRGEAVDMLDRLIAEGIQQGASDIHLEPRDAELLVRIRIDGILRDYGTVDAQTTPYLMSRLKIAAGLDIADRLRPQDGSASVMCNARQVDLRVSTLPLGDLGEKGVVRLLDATRALKLSALGFTASERERLDQLLSSTEGMILVTGPTGSGKTTTLYSLLRQVQTTKSNVMTVEDPIEYRLPGVNQVQVNERAGLTFATALRSILRQDPDVVLVGEIRGPETTSAAIKAAMTGHVVLSTLHTNDAPSAVSRLVDLGALASTLSAALKGVVAQRLVRRLCESCAAPLKVADLPKEQRWLLENADVRRLRRPVGCAECRGTGYKGRFAICELLVVTPDIQRAIARGAKVPELTGLAKDAGMHSLWEAGLARVIAGATSLHELLDNIAAPVAESVSTQDEIDRLLAQLRGPAAAPATAEATSASPASPIPDAPAALPASATMIPAATAAALEPPAEAIRLSVHRGAPTARVLLLHEHSEVRAAMRDSLRAAGYSVIEVADGESAVRYVQRLAPDVLLTDVIAPGLDAVGILSALGAAPMRTRVVVYADHVDEGLAEWLEELGARVLPRTCDVLEAVRGSAGLTVEGAA